MAVIVGDDTGEQVSLIDHIAVASKQLQVMNSKRTTWPETQSTQNE